MTKQNWDLTDSQVASINALLIVEGWGNCNHLEMLGGNPASLLNLVKRGIAEKRTSISIYGHEFVEFRYIRPQ